MLVTIIPDITISALISLLAYLARDLGQQEVFRDGGRRVDMVILLRAHELGWGRGMKRA